MSQVIVYTNQNGSVSVCIPTGEVPIQTVLSKDCPIGAIIVDSSSFPQGSSSQFFDSWELNGDIVSVDISKAKSQQNSNLNQLVYTENGHRAIKTLSGLTNVLSDSDWKALLNISQAAIDNSTTTDELVAAIVPVQEAITANSAI
jgi:hypothetical protein